MELIRIKDLWISKINFRSVKICKNSSKLSKNCSNNSMNKLISVKSMQTITLDYAFNNYYMQEARKED